jgi:hypothetical protein
MRIVLQWIKLAEADLRGTKSMAEIVKRLQAFQRIKPNFCVGVAGIKTIGK